MAHKGNYGRAGREIDDSSGERMSSLSLSLSYRELAQRATNTTAIKLPRGAGNRKMPRERDLLVTEVADDLRWEGEGKGGEGRGEETRFFRREPPRLLTKLHLSKLHCVVILSLARINAAPECPKLRNVALAFAARRPVTQIERSYRLSRLGESIASMKCRDVTERAHRISCHTSFPPPSHPHRELPNGLQRKIATINLQV